MVVAAELNGVRRVLRPERVPEVPAETARLAWTVHPKGTDEMRVRDALGPLFHDEDFLVGELAGMYPPIGQPALSPALQATVTVLQVVHNLSDREAAQAAAGRILWKYLLGLPLEAGGFDASVLCEFRARLVVADRADRLLGLVVERLKQAGLVRAGGRQRTDATHVLAAVRRLNRIEQVGEPLRAALEAIARVDAGWLVGLLGPGWDARYGRKVETSRLLKRAKAADAAVVLATRIGADGQALLDKVDADAAAGWIRELPQVKLLRTMWAAHYQPEAGGRRAWKPHAALPAAPERVESPYDVDAHYSAKPGIEWVGAKAHLTKSCDDDLPSLVTDVDTTPSTDPDVTATTRIQQRLIGRGLAPGEHLVDGGYPSADNLATASAAGITMISPLTVATGRNASRDTFAPSAFAIDWPANTATAPPATPACPATRTPRPGQVLLLQPPLPPLPTAAQVHPGQPQPAPPPHRPPQPLWEVVQRARQAQTTSRWRTTYNQRAAVEATISQAVRDCGLRNARYRGLPTVHLETS